MNRNSAVSDLSLLISGFEVSDFGEAELKTLLVDVRGAQRCLDGLVMRIGHRSNQLASLGHSAPADETLLGEGDTAVGAKQARQESKRTDAASGVDGLGEAVSHGQTSGEHVDAIARHTSKLTDEQRSRIDFDKLINKARSMNPDEFGRYVKRQVDKACRDHGLADTKAKQTASEFRHWFDHKTGMGRFAGTLDPERYEALINAVDQQVAAMAAASGEVVEKSLNLAADALVQLVLSGGGGGGSARNRLPSVTIVVDHDTVVHGAHESSVRATENGHDIAPETIARLCCDAVVRRVTLDRAGVPINVGRKYRTATDAQWAALKTLHAGCAWEGCSAPISWCQAHHIREWKHGGATDLDNLIPLCSRHHHRVHEGQWKIGLRPDRALEICKPNGSHYRTGSAPRRE